MKWLIRLSIAGLVLLLAGAGLVQWAALRSANPVGFQLAQASTGDDAPLAVAIAQSHADLALSLASAGYVVAAPLHGGDNFMDEQRAGTLTIFSDRVRDVDTALDCMSSRWSEAKRIDAARIGAFGMSAGGLAVLTEPGARPDMLPGNWWKLVPMRLRWASA